MNVLFHDKYYLIRTPEQNCIDRVKNNLTKTWYVMLNISISLLVKMHSKLYKFRIKDIPSTGNERVLPGTALSHRVTRPLFKWNIHA